MRSFACVFVLLLVIGSGCHSGGKVSRPPVKSKLADAATHNLMSVVSNYYQLKNALVASNAPNTAKAAGALVTASDSFSTMLKDDQANKTLLQPYLDTIVAQSKLVITIQDATCERQRLAFSPLSEAMYTLLKNADLKNAGVYHEFCPMAFNDKGAYWLSDESEIKNPYFGKKMLECGEVKDSL